MDKKLIVDALKIIILNPDVLGNLPNLPMKVMDKGVFWNVIGENAGWKIEQNTITRHVRILDDKGVRRAWGSMSAMEELFKKLVH